jgi:hypothetical protein
LAPRPEPTLEMKKVIVLAGWVACASADDGPASVNSASAARRDRAVVM